MALFYFVFGILMFIALVVIHEFGHFIVARRNGIEVEEFGIGFPPRAWGKKLKSGLLFSINWLPLGGFVKLKGEHDADTEKGTFGAATTWAKTKVMLAGVAMNLIGAFVIFTIVALIGMPRLLGDQYTVKSDTKYEYGTVLADGVSKDSPAAKAGLKDKDRILSINDRQISMADDLMRATSDFAGQTITMKYVSSADGSTKTEQTTLNQTKPFLGVAPVQDKIELRRSTWSAPIVAVGVAKDFTIATMKGLGTALKGLGSIIAGAVTGNSTARQDGQREASSQVSGPVGIFYVMYAISKTGFGLVLFVIGLISLTLAIMNALPIPALDGGRLFVTLLFRAMRKPLLPKIEERIHGTGFAVLMLLVVVITVVDVRRFF